MRGSLKARNKKETTTISHRIVVVCVIICFVFHFLFPSCVSLISFHINVFSSLSICSLLSPPFFDRLCGCFIPTKTSTKTPTKNPQTHTSLCYRYLPASFYDYMFSPSPHRHPHQLSTLPPAIAASIFELLPLSFPLCVSFPFFFKFSFIFLLYLFNCKLDRIWSYIILCLLY